MHYSYLALGDSYTIGEAVLLTENFPCQTISLLRNTFPAHDFYSPEIIAKTGWTTDELSSAIAQHTFLKKYDFVSLLIGVNNQYRGRSVEEFQTQFEDLLKQAIAFAGNDPSRVFVLSIPDWGIAPFAKDRNAAQIAADIDAYNAACEKVSKEHQCYYIDITSDQRKDGRLDGFVAADGLHPSEKEYAKWAELLSKQISKFVVNG